MAEITFPPPTPPTKPRRALIVLIALLVLVVAVTATIFIVSRFDANAPAATTTTAPPVLTVPSTIDTTTKFIIDTAWASIQQTDRDTICVGYRNDRELTVAAFVSQVRINAPTANLVTGEGEIRQLLARSCA